MLESVAHLRHSQHLPCLRMMGRGRCTMKHMKFFASGLLIPEKLPEVTLVHVFKNLVGNRSRMTPLKERMGASPGSSSEIANFLVWISLASSRSFPKQWIFGDATNATWGKRLFKDCISLNLIEPGGAYGFCSPKSNFPYV